MITSQSVPETSAVLDRFRAWVEVRGLSQSAAARILNVSAATLSQVFTGKYQGNVERVVERMSRALDRAARRDAAPQRPPFAMTSVAEDVLATLRTAHDEGALALILGPSGVGKTISLETYCRAEPETLLCTMRPASRRGREGSRPLLTYLAGALGVEIGPSTANQDLIERIGQALRGTERLLIVDEIDYAGEEALQALRQIHDLSGTGIVLVGTAAFLARLRARRSPTLNQVLNRIAYVCRVSALNPEDVERICEPFRLDAAARQAAFIGCQGVARRLAFGLVGAQRIAAGNGKVLNAQIIGRAYAQLMEL